MKRIIFTAAVILMAVTLCVLPSCKKDLPYQPETAYSTYDIHGYVFDAQELPLESAMVVFEYDRNRGNDPVMELIRDTTYTDTRGYYEFTKDMGIPVTGSFLISVYMPYKSAVYKNIATREVFIDRHDYDVNRGEGRYGLAQKRVDINPE